MSLTKSVTTIFKNWKSVKWYDGIVWNLATITQILLGECMFNFVQYGTCLHLSVQNVWGAHFFLDTQSWLDCDTIIMNTYVYKNVRDVKSFACRSASECRHFWIRLCFWPYFAPVKISRYLKWFKSYCIDKQTHPHPQTDATENNTSFTMLSLGDW